MAYSRVTKIGDGVSTQFTVNFALDYIQQNHVTARVGTEVDGLGAPVYRAITFLSTNLLQIAGPPAGIGVKVLFERTVPKDGLIVNYSNGDVLDEENLDTSQKQTLMAVQEVLDGRFTTLTQDLDMGGFKIKNLATPTDSTDAANKAYVDQGIVEFRDEVITVADNIASVVTVADNIANVNTVAENMPPIQIVADLAEEINTIADEAEQAAGSAAVSAAAAAQSAEDAAASATEAAQQVTNVVPSVVRFSGTGAATTFDLGTGEINENLTNVYLSGVYQQKDTYSIAAGILTFSTAPPTGTNNIEVMIAGNAAIAVAIPSDNTVSLPKLTTIVRKHLPVRPEDSTYWGSDNAAAIADAAAFAVSEGRELLLSPGGEYVVPYLSLPDDVAIRARRAYILRQGAIAARMSYISAGKGISADELNFIFDGTEQGAAIGAALITLDDSPDIGNITMHCDTQLGYAEMLNGIAGTGVRTRIGQIDANNLDYGLVLINPSTTDYAEGSVIGDIRMTNFMRPLYAQFVSAKFGDIRAHGRSSSAALVSAPGRYISNLLEGCRDTSVGNIQMTGSGHGIRIGGSPHANAYSRNISVGDLHLEAARGCALKIDPTFEVSPGVTEKANAIRCGDITSVDGGDGTYEGNRDFIRISHAVGVEVGNCQALVKNQSRSHQDGVLLNDVNGINIVAVHGDYFNSAFVDITGTSDTIPGQVYGGDVTNVKIGRLSGKCAGSNAIAVADAFNYGNISIGLDGISGFTRLFAWFTAGTLNGDFRLHGWVGGAVLPLYLNAPADARFRAEVEWTGKTSVGMAARLSHRAAFEVDGLPMNLAASPTDGEFGGLFISNYGGVAGDQAIGGTVMFGRPGSQYRNAAVGAMQFGATAANIGLGFWTSGTATSTHQMVLSGTIRADGNFETIRNNKGVIMQSPDGTRYLLRIANGGTVSITAAPV